MMVLLRRCIFRRLQGHGASIDVSWSASGADENPIFGFFWFVGDDEKEKSK